MRGKHEGETWFFRVADDRKQLRSSGWLADRVGLAVLFLEGRYTSPAELVFLEKLEDQILERCCSGQDARLLVVVTGPHMQEFIFQAHDGAALEQSIKSFEAQARGHEMQTFHKADPAWETVEAIASGDFTF